MFHVKAGPFCLPEGARNLSIRRRFHPASDPRYFGIPERESTVTRIAALMRN